MADGNAGFSTVSLLQEFLSVVLKEKKRIPRATRNVTILDCEAKRMGGGG